jgi:hypothetical protein
MNGTIKNMACFFCIILSLCGASKSCLAETPEDFIKNFFAWYFTASEIGKHAYFNDDIYNYVAQDAVSVAQRNRDEIDYFTKTEDYNVEYSDLSIKSVHYIDGGINIVHAAFKKHDVVDIVIFLQNTGDTFLILRVVDIYPY